MLVKKNEASEQLQLQLVDLRESYVHTALRNLLLSKLSFIHFLNLFCGFRGHGAARANTGHSEAKAGNILDRSPVCLQAITINKKSM